MKKSKIAIISAMTFLAIFILMPVDKEDLSGLTIEEIECAKMMAYVTFDNPIERGFIKDVAITHKENSLLIATSFTFGGIPLSAVSVDCPNGSARRL